jgi:hypothetical protein
MLGGKDGGYDVLGARAAWDTAVYLSSNAACSGCYLHNLSPLAVRTSAFPISIRPGTMVLDPQCRSVYAGVSLVRLTLCYQCATTAT